MSERNLSAKGRKAQAIYDLWEKRSRGVDWVSPARFAEWLQTQEAPCFFIEYEVARRHVSDFMRGKFVPKNELAAAQIRCLADRLRSAGCDGRYSYIPLMDIINGPAPSWFIAKETVIGIIYNKLRKKCKRK